MHLKRFSMILATGAALWLAVPAVSTFAADMTPAYVTSAVNDAGRESDKAVDAARKPAEMLVFAGVKPGDKVADLIPGGGYFTRLFSKAVGANGHVYAVVPEEMTKGRGNPVDAVQKVTADPAYPNSSVVVTPIAQFKSTEPLDVAWTSQNYHDLQGMGVDMAGFNKAVFAALKPGGTYIVLDHSAAKGSGIGDNSTKMHRSDEDTVKAEVTAAGFTYVGENNTLRNPADPRDKAPFDASIRGKTDKYIMKFRKP